MLSALLRADSRKKDCIRVQLYVTCALLVCTPIPFCQGSGRLGGLQGVPEAQVYEAKLAELHERGDPIKLRFSEAATRDGAAQALSNACQHNLSWCATEEPQFAHISADERSVVSQECSAALAWLQEKMAAQAALAKTEPPAVLTKELEDRKATLANVCTPVMTKAAPPPPKEEDKEEPAAATPTEGAEAAVGEEAGADAAEAPAAAAAAPSPAAEAASPMDES